jgi:pyridinium-3,5-biscarboxylic acid mononucleotide sulfurtransferase
MAAESLDGKFADLQSIIRDMQTILIAFSGGVDSTLLLKVAMAVLGKERILTVTSRSETTARHEMEQAVALAASLGAHHLVVPSKEVALPEFIKNLEDRCYVCKQSRFADLNRLAQQRGLAVVVDGTNLNDHSDYRPGMKAIRELGVRSPLSEANLNKSEIRLLSKKLELTTWGMPSYACLASRIPYGMTITAKKLRQVDACEDFIRSLDLTVQVRVRHYGDTARIEVDPDSLTPLTEASIRNRLIEFFRKQGFSYVTVDLEGYQMGSMNRVLDGSTHTALSLPKNRTDAHL